MEQDSVTSPEAKQFLEAVDKMQKKFNSKPLDDQQKMIRQYARKYAIDLNMCSFLGDLIVDRKEIRPEFGKSILYDIAYYIRDVLKVDLYRCELNKIIKEGDNRYNHATTKEEKETILTKYGSLIRDHKEYNEVVKKRYRNYKKTRQPTNGKCFETDVAHYIYQ
jgi:hypothetical protein